MSAAAPAAVSCARCGCRCGGRGLRVRVDLRRVYPAGDARARALLWVPGAARARPVRWLAARVRRLAPRGAPKLRLATGGHLLPPQEPLSLLRDGDTLQVLPADSEWRPEQSSGSEGDTEAGAPPAPPEEVGAQPPEQAGEAALRLLKLRALQVLEQYSPSAAEPASQPARRPRRRVRRRPRARPAPGPASPSPPPTPPPPAPVAPAPPAPRLVRALP